MTSEVKTLSDDALREIKARVAKATPAPLEARIGSGNNVCTALASNNPTAFDDFVCDVLPDYACKPGIATRWEANRDFIQHAYSDIPALCETVRVLRQRLNEEADRANCRTIELEHEGREIQKWNNRANQLAIEGQELRRQLTQVTQERQICPKCGERIQK